jgi:hypothetical protein
MTFPDVKDQRVVPVNVGFVVSIVNVIPVVFPARSYHVRIHIPSHVTVSELPVYVVPLSTNPENPIVSDHVIITSQL